MRLTAKNVQSVLGVYPEQLPDVLPKVFAGLLEPDQDPFVLQNYAVCVLSGRLMFFWTYTPYT